MTPPGASMALLALRKYSGVCGIACPSLAASAWKLFHRPMNLPGVTGASSLSAARSSASPAGSDAPNMSPRCGVTRPSAKIPKPPSKRTQAVMPALSSGHPARPGSIQPSRGCRVCDGSSAIVSPAAASRCLGRRICLNVWCRATPDCTSCHGHSVTWDTLWLDWANGGQRCDDCNLGIRLTMSRQHRTDQQSQRARATTGGPTRHSATGLRSSVAFTRFRTGQPHPCRPPCTSKPQHGGCRAFALRSGHGRSVATRSCRMDGPQRSHRHSR